MGEASAAEGASVTVVGAAGAAEAEEALAGAEVEVAASGAVAEEEGEAAAVEEEVAASMLGATGVVDGEGRRGTSQGRM